MRYRLRTLLIAAPVVAMVLGGYVVLQLEAIRVAKESAEAERANKAKLPHYGVGPAAVEQPDPKNQQLTDHNADETEKVMVEHPTQICERRPCPASGCRIRHPA